MQLVTLHIALELPALGKDKLSPSCDHAWTCASWLSQVAQGVALQRLEALEGLAAAAVAQDDAEASQGAVDDDGGSLQQQSAISMAGALRRLQVREAACSTIRVCLGRG